VARLIPSVRDPATTSPGEAQLFEKLRDDPGTNDWTVLHSLDLPKHVRQLEGEIDFVVIVPGKGLLCLEVKAHHYVRRDAAGLWQLGRSGKPTSRSPFRQASEARHSLQSRLHSALPTTKRIPMWSAVIFTHADFVGDVSIAEWHPWQCIEAHDFQNRPISELVLAILRSLHGHLRATPSATWFDASAKMPTTKQVRLIVDELRPKFEMRRSPHTRRALVEDELLYYTDEQFTVLDALSSANPRLVVDGAAGTGKTILALEAARRAGLDGAKVGFFCFNRLLGNWLTEQLPTSVTSGTLHSYLLRKADVSAPLDVTQAFWDELPESALHVLLDKGYDFDVVILDEAQDLLMLQYLDVIDLSLRGGLADGRWLVFGDFKHQVIFGDRSGLGLLEERSGSLFRYPLRYNCRNTPEVAQFAERLAGLDPGYKGIRRTRTGIDPTFRYFESDDEQSTLLANIIAELESDGFEPDEIVVLSTRRDVDCAAAAVPGPLATRLQPLSGRVTKHQIGYSSINAFKGLEAAAVVLTDVAEVGSLSARDQFYTGFTRATDRTYVIAKAPIRSALTALLKTTELKHG